MALAPDTAPSSASLPFGFAQQFGVLLEAGGEDYVVVHQGQELRGRGGPQAVRESHQLADRAIELDPESGHAYYTLSVILLDKNEDKRAWRHLLSAGLGVFSLSAFKLALYPAMAFGAAAASTGAVDSGGSSNPSTWIPSGPLGVLCTAIREP